MVKQMKTIKDIAKALNMSPSTVSRALHNEDKISLFTRERVRAYADKINYKPNHFAQSLRKQRSLSVGVVLSSIPNSFFAEVINGIESVMNSKGYFTIITQSHESYAKELSNIGHLASRAIDGLLVSVASETKDFTHFKALQDMGMPVVFFDRTISEFPTHQLVSDGFKGSYLLTQHLIEQGYTRIAHITGAPHLSTTQERLGGYKRALQEAGIAYNPSFVKYTMRGGMSEEENQYAFAQLMTAQERPEAITTASDRLTLSIFSLAIEQGFAIPQELAIGGFNNFPGTHLFSPSLTSIQQPAFEMGKTAAEMLIELIERKKNVPVEYVVKQLQPRLLPGNSTLKK